MDDLHNLRDHFKILVDKRVGKKEVWRVLYEARFDKRLTSDSDYSSTESA